jgi:hypothetical protein
MFSDMVVVRLLQVFPVESVPGIRAVEQPDANVTNHFRFKIADIHTHPCVLLGVQRFPVRGASTHATAYGAQRLVALNVLIGTLRMAVNFDGANIVVRPECAQSSTDGAVAISDLCRSSWNLNMNGTAVASGCEHGLTYDVIGGKVSELSFFLKAGRDYVGRLD